MTTITDFVFACPVTTSKDFIRCWAPAYDNLALVLGFSNTSPDSASDAQSIINFKFFILANRALSTTNEFGAEAHYTSINNLCITTKNAMDTANTTIVNALNTIAQFTVINTTKFDTIINSINASKLAFQQLGASATSLKAAVVATKNGLTGTSATYTTVKGNYDQIASALGILAYAFTNSAYTLLDSLCVYLNSFKNAVINYNDEMGNQDKSIYMTASTNCMKNFLYGATQYYIRTYSYQGLTLM